MKITKEARRTARTLFRDSFTAGRLDDAKVRTVINGLVAAKPRELLPILKTYARLVRIDMDRNIARVESAVELDSSLKQQLAQKVEQIYRRPIAADYRIAPELIGGVRLQVGNDVWDGSIAQQLRQLSEQF